MKVIAIVANTVTEGLELKRAIGLPARIVTPRNFRTSMRSYALDAIVVDPRAAQILTAGSITRILKEAEPSLATRSHQSTGSELER